MMTIRTAVAAVPVILAAALAGCAMPQSRVEHNLETMKPGALEAARERAQTDLNCGSVKTEVLEHDQGDMGKAYGLNRVVYKVKASGCGRTTTLAVACTPNSVCSAMSDSGIVERE